jgi:hypothetical protein
VKARGGAREGAVTRRAETRHPHPLAGEGDGTGHLQKVRVVPRRTAQAGSLTRTGVSLDTMELRHSSLCFLQSTNVRTYRVYTHSN